MPGSYIISGARTPIGKLSGAFSSFSAADLGGIAIAEAIRRAGIAPSEVEHVIVGQVLTAGQGQVPSRQASVKAGIPMNVPSVNVNKVCLSGLNAIFLADQMIASGEADIVIAAGMESMTNAPYLTQGARNGFRYGNTELADAILKDGLWCAFDECLMGLGTEKYVAGNISRAEQDELAVISNQRATDSRSKLAEEIVAVPVPQRKGDPLLVSVDEGIRAGTTSESLSLLKPAFDKSGTITAGNASQISDGASALVMMSDRTVRQRGFSPMAEFVSYGMVAGPDSASLLHQPSRSITRALQRGGINQEDLSLYEINEAFAAVGISSMRELGITIDCVNVNGGAIALGHPIGMSGNRLALTLMYELRRRGGGLGAAALCGGGGQGDALILKVG